MAYGSTLYNADALAKDPDLAAAHVRGPSDKQLTAFATARGQPDHATSRLHSPYAHNPHMQRALALAARDLTAGLQRRGAHQAAHSVPGQDARGHTILTGCTGARVHWNAQQREYVVPPTVLEELGRFFADGQGAPQAGTTGHTRLIQNALADWAAKRRRANAFLSSIFTNLHNAVKTL
jgi:hypothetical protein